MDWLIQPLSTAWKAKTFTNWLDHSKRKHTILPPTVRLSALQKQYFIFVFFPLVFLKRWHLIKDDFVYLAGSPSCHSLWWAERPQWKPCSYPLTPATHTHLCVPVFLSQSETRAGMEQRSTHNDFVNYSISILLGAIKDVDPNHKSL